MGGAEQGGSGQGGVAVLQEQTVGGQWGGVAMQLARHQTDMPGRLENCPTATQVLLPDCLELLLLVVVVVVVLIFVVVVVRSGKLVRRSWPRMRPADTLELLHLSIGVVVRQVRSARPSGNRDQSSPSTVNPTPEIMSVFSVGVRSRVGGAAVYRIGGCGQCRWCGSPGCPPPSTPAPSHHRLGIAH